jgi:hypothetical protein
MFFIFDLVKICVCLCIYYYIDGGKDLFQRVPTYIWLISFIFRTLGWIYNLVINRNQQTTITENNELESYIILGCVYLNIMQCSFTIIIYCCLFTSSNIQNDTNNELSMVKFLLDFIIGTHREITSSTI